MKKLLAVLALLLFASGVAAQQSGNVGGYNKIFSWPPASNATPFSTSAYTANYAMGGLQTLSVFRVAVQPSGLVDYVGVGSKGGMTTGVEIWGFTKNPASACKDSTAFTLSPLDLPYIIPGFPVLVTPAQTNGQTPAVSSQNINNVVSVQNADSPQTTNLYFCAVTIGTPTLGSTSDLVFTYAVSQD